MRLAYYRMFHRVLMLLWPDREPHDGLSQAVTSIASMVQRSHLRFPVLVNFFLLLDAAAVETGRLRLTPILTILHFRSISQEKWLP